MHKRSIPVSKVQETCRTLENKVLVGGCFDVLHIGHIRFLQQAKEQGKTLIVALEPDQFIIDYKHRQPFHTQKERAEILLALSMVDYVIILPLLYLDRDYARLVVDVSPHIIAVTEGDAHMSKKMTHAKTVGALVRIVSPLYPGVSTTEVLKNINRKRKAQ